MPLKLLFVRVGSIGKKLVCGRGFFHCLYIYFKSIAFPIIYLSCVNGVLMDGILYQYKLEYFQEMGA